jgi:hypothetical protein
MKIYRDRLLASKLRKFYENSFSSEWHKNIIKSFMSDDGNRNFRLVTKTAQYFFWWSLITMGCAIIIFDSSRYKKTVHETANTASDDDHK